MLKLNLIVGGAINQSNHGDEVGRSVSEEEEEVVNLWGK